MSGDHTALLHRYLDDELTQSELDLLESALLESRQLRQALVQASMLDERLARSFEHPQAVGASHSISFRPESQKGKPTRRTAWISRLVWISAVVFFLLGIFTFTGRNQLSASPEIKRMLRSLAISDRLYQIDVEQIVLPSKKELQKYDRTRPPKQKLEGAKLYLRGLDQFVLIRYREDGARFLTGTDGRIGWAIAPSGPVRTSSDIHAFNRDIPGHEHSIPLADLSQGLAQIQKAYTIQIVPVAPSDAQDAHEAMLIATKKKGERGPKRIEIQYEIQTGRIAQMRFIEMPYGPEKQTVRLTLLEEASLPTDFFDYSFHQSSNPKGIESRAE